MKYEDQEISLKNAIAPGDEGYEWSHTLLSGLNGDVETDALNPKLSSEFNLPSIMSFGAAYQLTSRLRLEGNYVHFGWSHFEKLAMDFDIDDIDQDLVFKYDNAWQVRFGLDFAVVEDELNLMFGFVHDTTPQPLQSVSPLLPDSDRNVDTGMPANEEAAYPVGTYSSIANIFGAGVGYHF